MRHSSGLAPHEVKFEGVSSYEGRTVLRRSGIALARLCGSRPKPMVSIGYRPILWHVMKYFAHFGHKDFILCLGYRADLIKAVFFKL